MAPTPPKPQDELTIAAARLSRAAPNSWDDFVAAFEKYTASRILDCVKAGPDQVFQAQGRAQQCGELETLLKSAIVKANQTVQAK